MKLIKSKRLFELAEVQAFIETLPNKAAQGAKVFPIVELSAIGNLYVGYFVLYEA